MKKKKDESSTVDDNIGGPSENQESEILKESKSSLCSKKLYFLLAFVAILIAIVVAGSRLQRPERFRNFKPVSHEVFSKFNEYDQDDDGYLSPVEFETAYLHLTEATEAGSLGIKDVEVQNVVMIIFYYFNPFFKEN